MSLDILEPGKPPDLSRQLFQFPIPDITIGPLGKLDDLRGHIDEDHDERRNHDEEYGDRHQERDRVVPFREGSL